jgi:hypothetical protein
MEECDKQNKKKALRKTLQLKCAVSSATRTMCVRRQRTVSRKAAILSCTDIETCKGKVWKLKCKSFPNVLETQCRCTLHKCPFNSSGVARFSTCTERQQGSDTFPLHFSSFQLPFFIIFHLVNSISRQTNYRGGEWRGRQERKILFFTSNEHVLKFNGIKFEPLTYPYFLPLIFR